MPSWHRLRPGGAPQHWRHSRPYRTPSVQVQSAVDCTRDYYHPGSDCCPFPPIAGQALRTDSALSKRIDKACSLSAISTNDYTRNGRIRPDLAGLTWFFSRQAAFSNNSRPQIRPLHAQWRSLHPRPFDSLIAKSGVRAGFVCDVLGILRSVALTSWVYRVQ